MFAQTAGESAQLKLSQAVARGSLRVRPADAGEFERRERRERSVPDRRAFGRRQVRQLRACRRRSAAGVETRGGVLRPLAQSGDMTDNLGASERRRRQAAFGAVSELRQAGGRYASAGIRASIASVPASA